jgi:hypothetical protein
MTRRRFARWAALCATVAAGLLVAAPAQGADRIYWSNMNAGIISWANLDGSGGGDLPIDLRLKKEIPLTGREADLTFG